ncbi:uncharacterized protein LOC143677370 isoform X2 [Tamandua tetradactyla]|uniref:uncharacterized protein LOC143677370 isoform X2 n=1 Tax=Tamandua tetradactyla TaxID=48850 RepID=UPI0040539C67
MQSHFKAKLPEIQAEQLHFSGLEPKQSLSHLLAPFSFCIKLARVLRWQFLSTAQAAMPQPSTDWRNIFCRRRSPKLMVAVLCGSHRKEPLGQLEDSSPAHALRGLREPFSNQEKGKEQERTLSSRSAGGSLTEVCCKSIPAEKRDTIDGC